MHPSTPVRAAIQRVLRIGASRLALGVAVALAIIALALPFWSLSLVTGPNQDINSFSWTAITTDHYRSGTWDHTEIVPYTSSSFFFRSIASVLGTAYILAGVFVMILAVVLSLFSMNFVRTRSTVSLLAVSLLVVGVGLLALFYPLVAIPGAATTDVGTFTFGGFWGSIRTSAPARDWSWGPGLGWWLLLAAVLLGISGAALPYLKNVREMAPAHPRTWRPSN